MLQYVHQLVAKFENAGNGADESCGTEPKQQSCGCKTQTMHWHSQHKHFVELTAELGDNSR